MSRAPENPEQPDASDITVTTAAGTRFVSRESDVWAVEQTLAAEGRLPEDANRAVPLCEHPEHGDDLAAAELRERIERETETPVPNKQRIAVLNQRLTEVEG